MSIKNLKIERVLEHQNVLSVKNPIASSRVLPDSELRHNEFKHQCEKRFEELEKRISKLESKGE